MDSDFTPKVRVSLAFVSLDDKQMLLHGKKPMVHEFNPKTHITVLLDGERRIVRQADAVRGYVDYVDYRAHTWHRVWGKVEIYAES